VTKRPRRSGRTARNACASRSAAFTMRIAKPGKSAASSTSKDCAASPSSTQGRNSGDLRPEASEPHSPDRQRDRHSSSSPPCTDTPLRMHLTIHRTGGPARRRREGRRKRPAGNSHARLRGALSWSVYRDRRERLSGTGSPLSPQRQRSSSRRELVGAGGHASRAHHYDHESRSEMAHWLTALRRRYHEANASLGAPWPALKSSIRHADALSKPAPWRPSDDSSASRGQVGSRSPGARARPSASYTLQPPRR